MSMKGISHTHVNMKFSQKEIMQKHVVSNNSFMKEKNHQHKIQTTSVKYVMKFASKRSMVRHKLEIHDKEKLCQCSICNKSFSQKKSFNRHIESVHNRQNSNNFAFPS